MKQKKEICAMESKYGFCMKCKPPVKGQAVVEKRKLHPRCDRKLGYAITPMTVRVDMTAGVVEITSDVEKCENCWSYVVSCCEDPMPEVVYTRRCARVVCSTCDGLLVYSERKICLPTDFEFDDISCKCKQASTDFCGTCTHGTIHTQWNKTPYAQIYLPKEAKVPKVEQIAPGLMRGFKHKSGRYATYYGRHSYAYGREHFEAQPKPAYVKDLEILVAAIAQEEGLELTDENFEMALVNYYPEGTTIPWHSDNEKDIDFRHPIISLSLGGASLLKVRRKQFRKNGPPPRAEVIAQQHLSLVFMRPDMQDKYEHMVSGVLAPRVNITWRAHVDFSGSPSLNTTNVGGIGAQKVEERKVVEPERNNTLVPERGAELGSKVASPRESGCDARIDEQRRDEVGRLDERLVEARENVPAESVRQGIREDEVEEAVQVCTKPTTEEVSVQAGVHAPESAHVAKQPKLDAGNGSNRPGGLGRQGAASDTRSERDRLGRVPQEHQFEADDAGNVRDVRKQTWADAARMAGKRVGKLCGLFGEVVDVQPALAVVEKTSVSTQVCEHKSHPTLGDIPEPDPKVLPVNWEAELQMFLNMKIGGAPRTPSTRRMLTQQAYDWLKKWDVKASGLVGTSELANAIRAVVDKVALDTTSDKTFMERAWETVDARNIAHDFYTKGIIRMSYLNKWFAFLLSWLVWFVIVTWARGARRAIDPVEAGYYPVGARELLAHRSIVSTLKMQLELVAEPVTEVKVLLAAVDVVWCVVMLAGFILLTLLSCWYVYVVIRRSRMVYGLDRNLPARMLLRYAGRCVMPTRGQLIVCVLTAGSMAWTWTVHKLLAMALAYVVDAINKQYNMLWWFVDRDSTARLLGYEFISRDEMTLLTRDPVANEVVAGIVCYLVALAIVFRLDAWVERVARKGN